MGYVKCPNCDLNYMQEGEEMCEQCRNSGITQSKERNILSNAQLGGQKFHADLRGYGAYLIARNYGTYSANGNMTTTISYVRGIVKIAEIEQLTFDEMLSKIDSLVETYGLTGEKKAIGQYQKGTWRNALNRLQDFRDYLKFYC